MRNFMICRRTFLATLGILCLTGLGAYKGMDVSLSVAGIVAAVAGANSYEKSKTANSDVLTSK